MTVALPGSAGNGPQREVYTVAEFAHLIGTSPKRVYEYIKAGHVRAIRHGRCFVIAKRELPRYLEAASHPDSDKNN